MSDPLRSHLVRLLDSPDAHATFEAAVEGLPPELRGRCPDGFPHSPWQLLDHLRIAQADILAFCLPGSYLEMSWPGDYWPASAVPAPGEWEGSVAAYLRDREALRALASDPAVELAAPVPHATSGQTYLRELLLVADHNAYHIGQMVAVRRALGAWPGS